MLDPPAIRKANIASKNTSNLVHAFDAPHNLL